MCEWIIGRDPVRVASVHIQAQDLAQQSVGVLAVPEWITGASAVSKSGIEIPIGSEGQDPAIVIGKWIIDTDQGLLGARVRLISIRRDVKTRDHVVLVIVGVVDEEEPVLRILRMEGQAEQALFVAVAVDAICDVQEWSRLYLGALENADTSHLFDDEHPSRAVIGKLDIYR